MEVVKDAKSPGATRGLRVEQLTVRHMEEGRGVSALDALKVLRVRLITALHTEVVGVVVIRAVPRLPVGSQACASGMVEGRGAKWKAATEVLKGRLGYVSLTVEVDVANMLAAPRGLKGAPCIARRTAGASGVYLLVVRRALKVARHFARGTVVVSAAFMTVVESALRACMVGLTTVSRTVVGSAVLCQAAPRVPGGALTAASSMVGANAAGLRIVERVHKEAQISARLTVEGSGVHGATAHAKNLLEERVGCVQLMAAWSKTVRCKKVL